MEYEAAFVDVHTNERILLSLPYHARYLKDKST